jgi:hypothetical protein
MPREPQKDSFCSCGINNNIPYVYHFVRVLADSVIL